MHFVIVEYGVRLEVLDWGGTGQPVVLLAGSGNTDRSSFQAYRDSQMSRDGFAFPESELRNQYEIMPDGSVGPYKASTPAIHHAIGVGALKRDYSRRRSLCGLARGKSQSVSQQ